MRLVDILIGVLTEDDGFDIVQRRMSRPVGMLTLSGELFGGKLPAVYF